LRRVWLYAGAGLDHDLPIFYASCVAEMRDVCHHAQLMVEMGNLTFLPRLDLNSDPPNLCLLSIWDY
jgi:hypothetical protein